MRGQTFGFPESNFADVQVFNGNAPSTAGGWEMWQKRPGVSMCGLYLCGGGGGGGNGFVGANSAAGGGGSGGSGATSYLIIPAIFLPDTLWISVGIGGSGAIGTASRVAIAPNIAVTDSFLIAPGGGLGGTGTSAAGGSAGAAGVSNILNNSWLVSSGISYFQSGNPGFLASLGAGTDQLQTSYQAPSIPATPGGGLPAAAAVGNKGSGMTMSAGWPSHPAGVGGATATTPGGNGSHGYRPIPGLIYSLGGTGGGSSHGSATGAGLFGGNGGDGGPGCGGGGGGACLTGGTPGKGGRGGNGWCYIISW